MIIKDGSNIGIFAMNRFRFQYARVILLTSLFWVLIDVFLIYYLTNECGQERIIREPCNPQLQQFALSSQLLDDDQKARKTDDETDEKLRLRNERLHRMHKLKGKETPPPPTTTKDDRKNFLNKLAEWFREDSSLVPTNPPSWPGENGRAVQLPDNLKDEGKKRFKENQFNIVASDMVALNRSVPDQRSASCKSREYRVDLPTTSIVIVYHNEGNSTLLRGLTSIIRKSPNQYLKEIILVDDCSQDREYLHGPLDEFVKRQPVAFKVFRNKERLGLMRSRLVGADAATGDTLTFLDAHIEATDGWLPPLLSEIKKNRQTVACPIIDVISDDTFAYLSGSESTSGGFNEKLNFRWYPVPQHEVDRRGGDKSLPLRFVSPFCSLSAKIFSKLKKNLQKKQGVRF
jgi:hypothetical protein